MRRLIPLLLIPLAMAGALGGLNADPDPQEDAAAGGTALRFGADAESLDAQRDAGFTPDLATVWVGPWTLEHGWAGTDRAVRDLVAADVRPVIHFYYWGDDLSVGCLEQGCWSDLHDTHKDMADWQRLAIELVAHLERSADGMPVFIVLETEFNRGNVARHEPLDGYLAEKARFFHEAYPPAEIVLGLGNWNRDAWHTWDRAAEASDMIGFQLLRGSTRDAPERYTNAANASIDAAKRISSLFDHPVMLHDLGLSSHPEPEYALLQARTMRDLFRALPELKTAGVEAVLYRSWFDDPAFDIGNHYGVGERHWGLAWPGTGDPKPAGAVWMAAALSERTGVSHPLPPVDPVLVGRGEVTLAADAFPWRRGAAATTDGRATDGVAWSLSANGSLLQPIRVEPGTYRVEVLSRAPAMLPHDAALEVSWNDRTLGWVRPGLGYERHAAVADLAGEGNLVVRLVTNGTPVQDPKVLLDAVRLVHVDGPPDVDLAVETQGLQVVLDARRTFDQDADELTFRWSLGDGGHAVGPRVVHRYDTPGTYEVTLTVQAGNETVFRSTTLHVDHAPDEDPPLIWLAAGLVLLLVAAAAAVWRRRDP